MRFMLRVSEVKASAEQQRYEAVGHQDARLVAIRTCLESGRIVLQLLGF